MDSRGQIGAQHDHKDRKFDYTMTARKCVSGFKAGCLLVLLSRFLAGILCLTVYDFFTFFYMELLYLFLKTPRGTLKC